MNYPLTLVIITKNESRVLSQCLEAASWIPNKVVVDSGSTDDTILIAKGYGATVIHQDWLGFGPQRQFAVKQAPTDWVLCIDADEFLTDALSQNIKKLFQEGPQQDCYELKRYNKFIEKILMHGESPDLKIMLFNKRKARWSDDLVHEKVIGGSTGRIEGVLVHESCSTIYQYLQKQNTYTEIQANKLFTDNRKITVWALLSKPTWRFIKYYFLKKGFLDGMPGLIHIIIGCCFTFIKYIKAYELFKNKSHENSH